jgi:hypothetical protein
MTTSEENLRARGRREWQQPRIASAPPAQLLSRTLFGFAS